MLRELTECLTVGTTKIYGFVLHDNPRAAGWHLTKESRSSGGQRVLQAGLFVASTVAHMDYCTTFRLARGVQSLQALHGLLTVSFGCGDRNYKGGDIDEAPIVFDSQYGDVHAPVPLRKLINEEWEVRQGEARWTD